MASFPPGLAESALLVTPVWEHLNRDHGNEWEVGVHPKQVFRATSRALRDLADDLITSHKLHLGGVYSVFKDDPATWPEEQRQQQQRARSLLVRRRHVRSSRIQTSYGGWSQLVQLLDEGLMAGVKELNIITCHHNREDGCADAPSGIISKGAPSVEVLTLSLFGSSSGQLLLGLSGCSQLQKLEVFCDEQLPSGFLADLAGCSSLRSLDLTKCANSGSGLSKLTQLTQLDSTHADVGDVAALEGLKKLQLVSLKQLTGLMRLSTLAALTHLRLGNSVSQWQLEQGYELPQAAQSLAETLWEDLQAMTQLQELALGQDVCMAWLLWLTPFSCRHQHLVQLEVHLDRAFLPAWSVGDPVSLPALQELVVSGRANERCDLWSLHMLLQTAPKLQKVVLSSWINIRADLMPESIPISLRCLRQVAGRLAAIPTVQAAAGYDWGWLAIEASYVTDGINSFQLSDEQIIELMRSLSPLKAVKDLALRLDITVLGPEAMAELYSSLPNLHSLQLDAPMLMTAELQEATKFQNLQRFVLCQSMYFPPPTTAPQAIQIIGSMQGLSSLGLHSDRKLGLPPRSPNPGPPTLPNLKGLAISQCYLQDLLYLLDAAPSLQLVQHPWLIICSPDDTRCSSAELAQQLEQVMMHLAQRPVQLTPPNSLSLSFKADATAAEMVAMLQALRPWATAKEPLRHLVVHFQDDCVLTADAIWELVTSVPHLESLELQNFRVEDPGVLFRLGCFRRLSQLTLRGVTGPDVITLASDLAVLEVVAPALWVHVEKCEWWTSDVQLYVQQRAEALKSFMGTGRSGGRRPAA